MDLEAVSGVRTRVPLRGASSRRVNDECGRPSGLQRFWLRSPEYVGTFAPVLFRIWFLGGFVGFLLTAAEAQLAPFATGFLFFVWLAPALIPMSIVVGTDGVLIRWLWMRRFIGHADLEFVYTTRACHADGFALVFGGGKRILLAVSPWASRVAGSAVRADHIVEQIRAYSRDARSFSPAPVALQCLRRHGRSTDQWARDLVAVGQPDGAPYRTAGLRSADLWAAVGNVREDSQTRAGALAAMCEQLGAERRQELLRMGRATAHPALRRVLLTVARNPARVARALRWFY